MGGMGGGQGGAGGMDPNDIFKMFFSGMGGGPGMSSAGMG